MEDVPVWQNLQSFGPIVPMPATPRWFCYPVDVHMFSHNRSCFSQRAFIRAGGEGRWKVRQFERGDPFKLLSLLFLIPTDFIESLLNACVCSSHIVMSLQDPSCSGGPE